jgi:hypothetical protein
LSTVLATDCDAFAAAISSARQQTLSPTVYISHYVSVAATFSISFIDSYETAYITAQHPSNFIAE